MRIDAAEKACHLFALIAGLTPSADIIAALDTLLVHNSDKAETMEIAKKILKIIDAHWAE